VPTGNISTGWNDFQKSSNLTRFLKKLEDMAKFIELIVSEEFESKKELVNIASIGRIYPNPQSRVKSIVELNYQSVNDTPVYLEVDMAYETLRSSLMS
jgi:hypothetical protein